MNFYNEIHSSSHPDFELYRPSAVAHFPHSVECGSRWQTYGSSSDWTVRVVQSAHGEQLERKHFFLDIASNGRGRLSSALNAEEADALANALLQTSKRADTNIDILKAHEFELTRAFRVVNLTECAIPSILISISPTRNPFENALYPVRDTCGCSAHATVELAILGALKEAIERQFLLRFWLTNTCTGTVSIGTASAALRNRPSLQLFNELARSGEVCILDITDHRFPGCCLLLCYGSDNENQRVRYCAGMSYADDLTHALEKSVLELWQTFRFMDALYTQGKDDTSVEDPYLRHFLSCNTYSTYTDIKTARLSHVRIDHQLSPDRSALTP